MENNYYMTTMHYALNLKMTIPWQYLKYIKSASYFYETLDKKFTDKYKSFIDEDEKEHEKINELEKLK